MSFDTAAFWVFFAAAWACWRWLPYGLARTSLCGFSLLFYGWWDVRYVPLLVVSATLDFWIGGRLHRSTSAAARRALVTASVVLNLFILAFFKYTPLAARSLGDFAGFDGRSAFFETWVVPVGISFFTFQTMSYTIDLYRRRVAPAQSYRDFLLYVSFFPQLVAGPIVRAATFLPQLQSRSRISRLRVRHGVYRCIEGLFLKVVVADGLAPAVIRSFDQGAEQLSPAGAWYAAILFGAQIFADFAGYTGIAIGVACLMGLRFPENFRAPYIATSLSNFWTRWHISLSSWLRDYLYIPLGGNRRGPARTYVNLMVVMVLGGLWHGAAWNFVVWGALHGAGLVIARGFGRAVGSHPKPGRGLRTRLAPLGKLAAWTLVFAWVHVAWVFFRGQDLATAQIMVSKMTVGLWRETVLGADIGNASPSLRYAVLLLPVALMHLAQLGHEVKRWPRSELVRAVAAGAMLFGLAIFERGRSFQFIYFQF